MNDIVRFGVVLVLVVVASGKVHSDTEPLLKFPTPCSTPRGDEGLCVEIQSCPILHEQLKPWDDEAVDNIDAHRCGPPNEDTHMPKVCCSYRDISAGGSIEPTRPLTIAPPKKDHVADNNNNNNPFPAICGQQRVAIQNRIYGGDDAALGEFPWMARLKHRRADGYPSYGCAGFLIASQFVLTAAHCIQSNKLEALGSVHQVQLGEHNIDKHSDCAQIGNAEICADPPQLIKIGKPIVHPDYSNTSRSQHHDLALLPLKSKAIFTAFVQPVCVSEVSSCQPTLWISGWGKTETSEYSPIKQKIEVPSTNQEECARKYKDVNVKILESQLCAGGEKNRDSCTGDSGGPIMTQNNQGQWVAEGIVSFGMGCGDEHWPGVYTRISHYMPWIRKMMNRHIRNKRNKRKTKTAKRDKYHV